MHAEDEADDQLIVDELQSQVITRSQSQAIERAKQHTLVPSVTPQTAASSIPRIKVLRQFLSLNRHLQSKIILISQCQKCRNYRWHTRS